MDYYLNDSSLTPPYKDHEKGIADLITIMNCLAELDILAEGQLPALRTNIEPWMLNFSEVDDNTLTLGEIANSLYETDHHQVAIYFSTLALMTPADINLADEVIDTVLEMDPLEAHPKHADTFPSVKKAQVNCCFCALTSNILVSFPTTKEWDFAQSGFTFRNSSYEFDHISEKVHLKELLVRRHESSVNKLCIRDFWEQKEEVFAHLKFGLDVRKQIVRFNPKFEKLLYTRLLQINTTAKEWQSGEALQPIFTALEVTDESELTMQNYGTERNFHGYDGIIRTFEKHIWIDGSNRIHIFIHNKAKIIEIGYVGKHLSTWTN